MKYIRTMWSIYEVVEETELVYRVKAKWHNNHIYSKSKCQTEVLKQADTIEELCDCFIGIAKSGDFIQLGKWELDAKHYDLTDVYGAVLVKEKGIIFVAKMNEKGDFELL